jgi:hypothetical protein
MLSRDVEGALTNTQTMTISVLLPFVHLDGLGIQEKMGLEEVSRSKPNELKAPLDLLKTKRRPRNYRSLAVVEAIAMTAMLSYQAKMMIPAMSRHRVTPPIVKEINDPQRSPLRARPGLYTLLVESMIGK